jgi:tripartite-type tricarboxylate transporter receptor subunit TctC
MLAVRALLCALAYAGLAVGMPATANAQTYPDKPIKLIVPYPPGGPVDAMARFVAQPLSVRLGQSVVVDNRPGAGGTLAARAAASAEPDGYTLLLGSSGSLAIAPALYANLDYNPFKSFAPIATVSSLPNLMVVTPEIPARTVPEFIAYAKAHPGKLNYGASLATPPHLLSALFAAEAGIDVVYIPYKGSAPSVTDLLGGRTQWTVDGLTILYPLVKQGKLRALAIATSQHWPELPDVPTLVECGFPDFTLEAWTGVVAPAGTPAPIIDKLNAAINADLRTPELEAGLHALGAVLKTGSPQDFAAFLADQVPRWAKAVKVAGVKISNQ